MQMSFDATPHQSKDRFSVEVRDVSHSFSVSNAQTKIRAVQDVTLLVQKGEFVAVVGASGCGKTTVLNMIAGLIKPEMAAKFCVSAIRYLARERM